MAWVNTRLFVLAAAVLPGLVLSPASAQPFPWPSASSFTLPPLPSVFPSIGSFPLPSTPFGVPTVVPSIPTTAAKTGPFTKGVDFSIKPRLVAPTRTLLANAMPFARYAPDGETLLLAGATAKVRSKSNPSGAPLPKTRAYRSAFSPDSKRLVTTDEDGQLVVWNVANGAVVRKIDNAVKQYGTLGTNKYWAAEVGFPDNDTVYLHDGCRLKKLDLSSPTSTLVPIGSADLCGHVRVSNDGKRFVVSEEGSKAYGEGIWYTRSSVVDSSTGVAKGFVDEAKVGPYTDVQLSPKGDRLCLIRKALSLACASIDDGQVDDITAAKVDRWFAYDATGEHLLYADRSDISVPTKNLYSVDFAARTVRRIAPIPRGITGWGYFAGSKRVAINGEFDGCIAFDLEAGWSMLVLGPKESAEGFFAVPSNPKRGIAGRANGPSRDLYWVDFPD